MRRAGQVAFIHVLGSASGKRSEIVWQTAEGKRTPATRDDVKNALSDAWIKLPQPEIKEAIDERVERVVQMPRQDAG